MLTRKRKFSEPSNSATTSSSDLGAEAISPIKTDEIQPLLPDINELAEELMNDNNGGNFKKRSGTTLSKFFKSALYDKLEVEHNQYGQPIGEGSAKFRSACGVISRFGKLCPLTYPRWNKMPNIFKELHVQFLKLYFIFDEDAMKKYIRKSIGQKWKSWKFTVHGFVDLNQSLEENMEKEVDPRVDRDQWKQLVPIWFDKDYQVNVSGKAKEYKAKHNIFHTCGRTPYAQIRENLGHDTGDIVFFQCTHTHEIDGTVDPSAAAILEKCKNIIEERDLEIDEVHTSVDLQAEIFSEVTGKERPGLGPTKSIVEVGKLKTQIEELKSKHKDEILEMEAKLKAEMKAEMKAQLEVQKEEFNAQMKDMFSSFIASQKGEGSVKGELQGSSTRKSTRKRR